MPVRERRADFESGNEAVSGASTGRRPDAIALDGSVAFSLGPDAEGDASAGLEARTWRVQSAADGSVYLARWLGSAWSERLLFTAATQADAVSFAFDLTGRPVVALESAGALSIWFFDPVLGTTSLAAFGAGRCPAVVRDDDGSSISDVQVFYLDGSHALRHRQQRDRYTIAIDAAYAGTPDVFVEGAFRSKSGRVVVSLSLRDSATGTYSVPPPHESALFPWRVTEAAMLAGSLMDGTLREAFIRLREDAGLGGALVSGLLGSTLLVYPIREDARLGGTPTTGALVPVIVSLTTAREDAGLSGSAVSGTLVAVVVTLSAREDASLSGIPTGGTLA